MLPEDPRSGYHARLGSEHRSDRPRGRRARRGRGSAGGLGRRPPVTAASTSTPPRHAVASIYCGDGAGRADGGARRPHQARPGAGGVRRRPHAGAPAAPHRRDHDRPVEPQPRPARRRRGVVTPRRAAGVAAGDQGPGQPQRPVDPGSADRARPVRAADAARGGRDRRRLPVGAPDAGRRPPAPDLVARLRRGPHRGGVRAARPHRRLVRGDPPTPCPRVAARRRATRPW